MTRTLVALAMAGITSSITPAYGADDVAQLVLVRPRATLIYELALDGQNHLVGRYGDAGGIVDLRKKDGVWSGPFGYDLSLYRGTADLMGDGDVKVTLTSARWSAPHQFVIRLTRAGDVEVRGRGGWAGAQHAHGFLSADATTLTSGHCGRVGNAGLSSCLRFTGEDGRNYGAQRDGVQNVHSPRFRLYADGHLTPAATAREDPVLYVLLYVLLGGS